MTTTKGRGNSRPFTKAANDMRKFSAYVGEAIYQLDFTGQSEMKPVAYSLAFHAAKVVELVDRLKAKGII